MTSLDETSAAIGKLEARADGADRGHKLILEKLDEIIDRLAEHDARVRENQTTLATEVLPEIRLWQTMRQRAMGGAAVILFLVSAVASVFTDMVTGFIRKFWGAV